jgi:crossover junction endodeoxyribonuclease RusA
MGKSIKLTLPPAISANRYWRSFVPRGHRRAIVVVSDEAKAFKSQVVLIAKQAGIYTPFSGRVQVDCQLYPALPKDAASRIRRRGDGWDDDVRSVDLDNALKVMIDALKGIAYEDDKQVWRINAERMEPTGEARLVVTITPIATNSPQARLV